MQMEDSILWNGIQYVEITIKHIFSKSCSFGFLKVRWCNTLCIIQPHMWNNIAHVEQQLNTYLTSYVVSLS